MPGAKHLRCSFCGKGRDEVNKFISGPSVYICDECINLCVEILDEDEARSDTGTPSVNLVFSRTLLGSIGLVEEQDGDGLRLVKLVSSALSALPPTGGIAEVLAALADSLRSFCTESLDSQLHNLEQNLTSTGSEIDRKKTEVKKLEESTTLLRDHHERVSGFLDQFRIPAQAN